MTYPSRCFYEPGACHIIDVAVERTPGRFRGGYSKETLYQIRKRHPRAKMVRFDDACRAIDEAENIRYRVGEATEETRDDFMFGLECLPPVRWTRSREMETFESMERTAGSITTCHIRIGSRYFSVQAHVRTGPDLLVEMARRAMDQDD